MMLRRVYRIRWSWNKTTKIKLEKDQSHTVKTHKYVPMSLILVVHCLKENEYFNYRRENCSSVYKKIGFFILLRIFLNKKIIFTEEDLTKYWSEKTFHICKGEFIQGSKD